MKTSLTGFGEIEIFCISFSLMPTYPRKDIYKIDHLEQWYRLPDLDGWCKHIYLHQRYQESYKYLSEFCQGLSKWNRLVTG